MFYERRGGRFFALDADGRSCMLVVAVRDSPRLLRAGR
jgi:hypothetical protein